MLCTLVRIIRLYRRRKAKIRACIRIQKIFRKLKK